MTRSSRTTGRLQTPWRTANRTAAPLASILAAAIGVAACVSSADGADVYAPRSAEETRASVMGWLARRGVQDPATASLVAGLWSGPGAPSAGREVFERVIQTFCLVDSATKRFVDSCGPQAPAKGGSNSDLLTRDESDEFYTMHLRLFYARSLAQRLLYDEALDAFARIDPARVVDPATCLFHRAVCEHQLMMKKEGLATLDKLLNSTQDVGDAYKRVAALMHDDLESLEDRSLGNVSRQMKDSERRLELGRGGQRVQKVQEEIVESLDAIIKKAEQQMADAASASGQNNSNRSGGPASDSQIKGATAPGDVDKKTLKKQGSWGGLPPAEVGRARQHLDKQFPSNYRQAVEEYFKKLANRPGGKGQ